MQFLDQWPQERMEAQFWVLNGKEASMETVRNGYHNGQNQTNNPTPKANHKAVSSVPYDMELQRGLPAIHYLNPHKLSTDIEEAGRYADLVVMSLQAYQESETAHVALRMILSHVPVLLTCREKAPESICAPTDIGIIKVVMRYEALRGKSMLLLASGDDPGVTTKSVMSYLQAYTQRCSFLHMDGNCLPALDRILPENCLVVLPANWDLPCGHSAHKLLEIATERGLSFLLTPNLLRAS